MATRKREAVAAHPAWYVETTADGGAHHGRMEAPDPRAVAGLSAEAAGRIRVVRADCGRVFLPLDYATRKGMVVRWDEPADEGHACPKCWEAVHGRGTSFYEVATEG